MWVTLHRGKRLWNWRLEASGRQASPVSAVEICVQNMSIPCTCRWLIKTSSWIQKLNPPISAPGWYRRSAARWARLTKSPSSVCSSWAEHPKKATWSGKDMSTTTLGESRHVVHGSGYAVLWPSYHAGCTPLGSVLGVPRLHGAWTHELCPPWAAALTGGGPACPGP